MRDIVFRDADGRPIHDAIVAVAGAPAEVADIGMMTDVDGRISLPVDVPGIYEFSVFHAGRARLVSARLDAGTQPISLIVPD